jgi:lactoylglutathione lyase
LWKTDFVQPIGFTPRKANVMLSSRLGWFVGGLCTAGAVGALAASPGAPVEAPSSASLDHVAIYVADLDRSATFYRDVLGFHEVSAPFPIARWLVTGNGLMIHLAKGRSVPVDNPKWEHFAIAWGPMTETIARLDAKKIPWSDIGGRHAPQVRPDGVKQIFVQDPDGHWIEINDSLKRE